MADYDNWWAVVEYEVEMFIQTSELLSSERPEFKNMSVVRNAIIESRLLHTRILVDVFLVVLVVVVLPSSSCCSSSFFFLLLSTY